MFAAMYFVRLNVQKGIPPFLIKGGNEEDVLVPYSYVLQGCFRQGIQLKIFDRIF